MTLLRADPSSARPAAPRAGGADEEAAALLNRLGPHAPEVVRHLQARLADEQRRREQFRQDLGTRLNRGEFIDGEVILPSPMRYRHRRAISRLVAICQEYVGQHSLGVCEAEGLLVRTTRNDYEPDLYFWPRSISDGFEPDQTVFPPPSFIAEVTSPSTEARDRGVKFEDYAAHGVAEYWIVDPEAETVECYDLAEGAYRLREKLTAASGGTLRCAQIQGLAFPVAAVFDDEANRAAIASVAGR